MSSDSDHDIDMSDSDDDEAEKAKRKARKGKGKAEDATSIKDVDMDAKSESGATEASESKKLSLLATQKVRCNAKLDWRNALTINGSFQILTPADFALLADLRIKAAALAAENGGGSSAKRKLAHLEANKKAAGSNIGQQNEAFLDEWDIMGPRKKAKQDYEERMASIQKGREGREKYGAKKDKRDSQASTTNREKARNKPIMMHLQ